MEGKTMTYSMTDLEDQIDVLRKDVAKLRRSATKRGRDGYAGARDSAADIYSTVSEYLEDHVPDIAGATKHARQTARENPVATAVIGTALLALLVGLFLKR
jgi:hypothetical protein